MENNKILRGSEFLVKNIAAENVFIPELFDEEQKMIVQTCEDFLEAEVFPILNRIDKQEPGLMRDLISKAGELGLLGISISEDYDGFGQNFVTSMLASEAMGAGHSFSVAYSAHTGIGSLPLAYYGTQEQKQKYLSKLATGEWAAAYCLTEPNAGSDANSGKTHANLTEDGKHYILNGQKMWITNGGFADLFTVFAKIDNDRVYSAFLVESNWNGVVINTEEKKMGIKGSSTVQLFFNDVKVPVENLLAKRGQGFRIALNILHLGRIKLGAAVLGSAKRTITQSVNYANERKQFGIEISSFAAIKYKLAQQAIRTWVTESAVYRIAENIDRLKDELMNSGMRKEDAIMEAIAQYAVEDAAMKVFGSETLDYVVDEGVQIFGGMGFSAEMPVDRSYRDSRINRIFEGTNEINRLLISETLIKKGPKVGINFKEQYEKISAEIENKDLNKYSGDDFFEELKYYLSNFKKLALLIIGSFLEKIPNGFIAEQEIMSALSDILICVYTAESAMLRSEKIEQINGANAAKYAKIIAELYMYDVTFKMRKHAYDAANSFLKDDELKSILATIDMLTDFKPVNIRESHRFLADKIIEENNYCF
ncbi:MAG: acyl-CoA dehydrogenase [Bacteroidetes bacterium CG2_30_33_31]|nr:MAG: acyl-CoA dehydrogenase [Bacteroidetes bacterium CG2_30_33_31]